MKILPMRIIEKCTRTVGDKNEIDEIMRLTLILQRIFGHQILDPYWTWTKSSPHQLAAGLLIVYITFGTREIVINTTSVNLLAEAMYTMVIIVMMPIRFYFFISTREHFRLLYIELKSSLYKAIKIDSEKTFQDVIKRTRKMVMGMTCMFCFPVAMYFLTALWHYVQGELVTMSKTTSILMPMKTPYYELGLVLHSIFMFDAAFTIGIVDMWYVVIMFFFCASCDSTVKILNVKKYTDEKHLEYATRLNNALRKFYKAHMKQIEFLYTLNAMYKWLAIMPLINVAMCMCLILLLMSKGIDLTFVSNLIPTIAELFVYNWFGEQVKNKAQNWQRALLEFDWLNLLPRDKKSYYIMACYMGKNFGMRTATGTELSLLTMSATLKFSYQAFTMLQTMEI